MSRPGFWTGGAGRLLARILPGKSTDAPEVQLDAPAIRRLVKAAGDGDATAQYRLAMAYLRGNGVPANPVTAAEWLRLAANAEHAEAQAVLASLLLQGLAGPEAGGLFTGAAPQSDPAAAAQWAERAAAAGSIDAQTLLGFLLATGQGIERDYRRAAGLYEQAAAAGSPQGALGLGLIRLMGLDAEPDPGAAVTLITFAADSGLATAKYVLGTLHEAGVGSITPSQEIAATHYREAAEAGVRPAQARLGLALVEGWGVPANPIEGERWLRRAAIAGDGEAAAIVGDRQASALGGLPNYLEAATWYTLAAEAGHHRAARILGFMHMTGMGVPQDPEESMRWLKQASDAGDGVAMVDLAQAASMSGLDSTALAHIVTHFHLLATRDKDKVAAYNLAVCAAQGIGRSVDMRVAASWLLRAADRVVNAQYWYARLRLDGSLGEPNPARARPWLRRASEAGMLDATVLLAELDLTGKGIAICDSAAALAGYETAATAGHVEAMFAAGAILGGGHNLPADRVRALAWFRKAATLGHPQAQFMLGRYLLNGHGCASEPVEGNIWLHSAAMAGVKEAQDDVAARDHALQATAQQGYSIRP